jgi:hypothetical protein
VNENCRGAPLQIGRGIISLAHKRAIRDSIQQWLRGVFHRICGKLPKTGVFNRTI